MKFSAFMYGLSNILEAFWGHSGEKGRCRSVCFSFSIMQLHT